MYRFYDRKKIHCSLTFNVDEVITAAGLGARSTTAHIVLNLRSLIWAFGESCTRLFMASLQSQKMSYHTCSVYIFVDLQPFGCNFKRGLFELPLRAPALSNFKLGLSSSRFKCGSRGWAHSIAGLLVRICFLLTDMAYLLPFLSYLAGSKVCPPADPPVRFEFDDSYRSRSHCFVDRQKIIANNLRNSTLKCLLFCGIGCRYDSAGISVLSQSLQLSSFRFLDICYMSWRHVFQDCSLFHFSCQVEV